VALAGVAVGSVAGAAMLIRALMTREGVPILSTVQMLAILALFLLPGLTYAAWELDRRAARERGPLLEDGESRLEENGLFEMPQGIELTEESRRAGLARDAEGPGRGAGKPRKARTIHRRRRHGAKQDAERGR
jgi:hypothetical protein